MEHQTDEIVSRPRILVLEDNLLIAGHVCDFLRECGLEPVGPAARVDAAARVLKGRRIDGAVIDVNLGGQSCFPICALLRRWNVPFLFLTASDTSDIPGAFRDAPLLSKPFVPDELCSTLSSLLGPSRAIERAA